MRIWSVDWLRKLPFQQKNDLVIIQIHVSELFQGLKKKNDDKSSARDEQANPRILLNS